MRGMTFAVIVGNLTIKPIVSYTKNGRKKAFTSVAVETKWKDSESGEIKTLVRFIPVVAWESKANLLEEYCEKGDRILVKGHFDTRVYENNGKKKYSSLFVVISEVLFLSASHTGKGISADGELLDVQADSAVNVNDLTEEEVKYFNLVNDVENLSATE